MVAVHTPEEVESVTVELPSFKVRVPVPLILKPAVSATLLLLTLKSRIQPVVVAVQAPIVSERIVKLVFTVVVQVVPPTQVAASKITASAAPGTEAPVAPPVLVDHIAVDEPSHVQVVVQTANRFAALATVVAKQRKNKARAKRRIMEVQPWSIGDS